MQVGCVGNAVKDGEIRRLRPKKLFRIDIFDIFTRLRTNIPFIL